jgi:Flp pilus assembly protein TadG
MISGWRACVSLGAKSVYAAAKAWARGEGASTSVMFAVAFPGMVAALGVASDFAVLNMKQNALQVAADQAAIAGAKELALAGTKTSDIEAAAKQYAYAAVEFQNKDFSIETKVVDKDTAVSVVLTERWTPFFAHFLNADVTPIVVKSKAQLAGEANICVLTLDPFGSKSIHMDDSSKLNGNGCGVYSNSKNPQAIRLDAKSEMKASLICTVGGVVRNGGVAYPEATEDCAVVEDPLASRPAPEIGSCVDHQLKITNGTHTLSPGNYCKGIEIGGDATVTFRPGTYVISHGRLKIADKAQAKGENVGFYLTGNQALLEFVGNSSINFSGATDGPMAGLLFFEDRSAIANRVHKINSTKAENLTGTIYLPRGALRVDPNAIVAQKSAYTAIIAYQLLLAEGPELVLNTNYDKSPVPVPEGLRAAADVVLAE